MSKQRLRFRIVLLAVWAAVTAAGCTRRDDAPFGLTGDAEVRLSIGLDKTENELSITKAGQPVLDPYRDLAVYVIDTHEDTLARWASFDAVPSTLKFTPGAYKVVAEYKPEGFGLPAFEAYSYRAEEKFVIKSKDKLQIDLVAKLATAKISVEFDPSFDFFYQSYCVDVRTAGIDSLRFAKGETRCGFFEPGSVRMRFDLVTPEGQKLVFSPAPLAKAKAADWYKLKLKVSSDQGSTQVIIIGTDDELNPEKDITVEVPRYFLPKDQPSFTAMQGFVSGAEQSVFEGEIPKWNVAANVPGGVSSFVIRLNDGAGGVLASKLGGETVIDLASLPEDSPLREKLRAAGFVWSAGLDSPEDASISTNVWIDFTDVMKAQEDGSAANYDFGFEVKDNYDQVPQTDHPCVVKAEIKTSLVTFVEPGPGNVWATKAAFTVKANYDLYNGERPVLQYRRTSSPNWNDTSEGDDVTVSPLPGDGDSYAMQYEMKGLQAGTEYVFRTVINGRYSAEYSVTTESESQIPNSDFSDYGEEPALFGVRQAFGGWATRNPATAGQMSQDNVAATAATCQNSTYRERDQTDGTYWIAMKTCYWGRSETRKQSWGTWGAWTNAAPKNVTAGILFLGDYSCTLTEKNDQTGTWLNYTGYAWEELATEDMTGNRGIAFGSRPAALKLNYIFLPKNDDNNRDNAVISVSVKGMVNGIETEIGRGEWKSGTTDDAQKTTKTPLTVPISYTVTDVKATRLDVFFSSSETQWPSQPACNGNTMIGNVFKIKDISLDYQF